MINRRDLLKQFAILTGSVAFGVAGHASDEDWLVKSVDACNLDVPQERWAPYEVGSGFVAYREGNINIIVALSDDFHDRWMKAHNHCVIERPRTKARRIRIFRHYLYGEAS